VVLGESLVLMVTGAFGPPGAVGVLGLLPGAGVSGEFGVLGGLSANLWFLF
jgi:hypothetical protein